MPETPSNMTIGKSTRESPIASCLSPPGSPNSPMIHGATTMKSEDEPEQARRDAPGALPLALLQQVAEDRDEGGGERGVGDERADRVRDQERDLERVDRADGTEVVARHDLADEAEDPGEAGGEREDRRRPREAAAGMLVHAASIGRAVNGAGWRPGALWYHLRARTVRAF